MTTPTQRTIADLKAMGFTFQVVERWNPFAKRRVDFLGCIDVIACKPGVGIVGIQATSGTNHSARREKAKAEPKLRAWLESGARFELWSYAKRGARGKSKTWELRREELTAADVFTA